MSILSANRRTAPEIPSIEAASDGLFIRIPRSVFSLNGFRQWVLSDEFPEKLRVTYVDGEIYLDMSKEELQTHALAKAEVARVLMNLNRELRLGQFYLDGVLVTNIAGGVSNNPDAVFIKWETLEKGRAKFTPRRGKEGQFVEIEGSPDWVLEIVSDSSVKKDTKKLRSAYWRAGIFEYWLVDARGSEINFQILYWRKKGYLASPNRGDGNIRAFSNVTSGSYGKHRDWSCGNTPFRCGNFDVQRKAGAGMMSCSVPVEVHGD